MVSEPTTAWSLSSFDVIARHSAVAACLARAMLCPPSAEMPPLWLTRSQSTATPRVSRCRSAFHVLAKEPSRTSSQAPRPRGQGVRKRKRAAFEGDAAFSRRELELQRAVVAVGGGVPTASTNSAGGSGGCSMSTVLPQGARPSTVASPDAGPLITATVTSPTQPPPLHPTVHDRPVHAAAATHPQGVSPVGSSAQPAAELALPPRKLRVTHVGVAASVREAAAAAATPAPAPSPAGSTAVIAPRLVPHCEEQHVQHQREHPLDGAKRSPLHGPPALQRHLSGRSTAQPRPRIPALAMAAQQDRWCGASSSASEVTGGRVTAFSGGDDGTLSASGVGSPVQTVEECNSSVTQSEAAPAEGTPRTAISNVSFGASRYTPVSGAASLPATTGHGSIANAVAVYGTPYAYVHTQAAQNWRGLTVPPHPSLTVAAGSDGSSHAAEADGLAGARSMERTPATRTLGGAAGASRAESADARAWGPAHALAGGGLDPDGAARQPQLASSGDPVLTAPTAGSVGNPAHAGFEATLRAPTHLPPLPPMSDDRLSPVPRAPWICDENFDISFMHELEYFAEGFDPMNATVMSGVFAEIEAQFRSRGLQALGPEGQLQFMQSMRGMRGYQHRQGLAGIHRVQRAPVSASRRNGASASGSSASAAAMSTAEALAARAARMAAVCRALGVAAVVPSEPANTNSQQSACRNHDGASIPAGGAIVCAPEGASDTSSGQIRATCRSSATASPAQMQLQPQLPLQPVDSSRTAVAAPSDDGAATECVSTSSD